MKRTAKWLTTVLSLAIVTNSMAVYSAGDAALLSQTSQPSHPSQIEETASDTVELAPAFATAAGEEITEWREEGVRHYYLGDGKYQAIVTTEGMTGTGDAETASTNSNVNIFNDTYILSTIPNASGGSASQLRVSENEITYMKFTLPELDDTAHIENAKLYFWYKSNVSSGSLNLKAYFVNFSWDESNLTWAVANSHPNLGLESRSLGGASLPGYTTTRQTYVDITNAVRLWTQENPLPNHGIALKRVGGQNSAVMLMSSEGTSIYRPYAVITYSLDLPVAEGTYYIRSGKFPSLFVRTSDGYSDQDDDNSTGVNTNDAFCELQSPFMGRNMEYSSWQFIYLNNGYYKIQNTTEQACLAVREGQENSNIKILVRELFTGAERQQWKITKLPNDRYQIEPRSAEAYTTEWVMSASVDGAETGYNVIQRANDGSGDLTNEWYILPLTATPRKSYDFSITYDNSSEVIVDEDENEENIEEVLHTVYQDVSSCLLLMYGIELKEPTISKVGNPSFSNECPTGEHEVVEDYITDSTSTTDRICRYAGYPLCDYNFSKNKHDPANGAAYPYCMDAVISTATTYAEDINMKITTLHELSHTWGASHETCISEQKCALQGDFGYWCDNCFAAINDFLGGTS